MKIQFDSDYRKDMNKNNMGKRIFKINPILEARVWGGQKLRSFFNYDTELPNIAEVYHVIAIPGHLDCDVAGTNLTLSEFFRANKHLFGISCDNLPVRLVTGNAADKLSYHLHPTDEYALEHEGMRGKHEGGLFFGGVEQAQIILGHNAESLEEFKLLSNEKNWDKLLRYVIQKENQFCDVPIGTLHGENGSGEEIAVAWSTNGDVTYRLYDHDRNDSKRPLHINQVYDNIKIPDNSNYPIEVEPLNRNGCKIYEYFSKNGIYDAMRIQSTTDNSHFGRNEFWFALNIGEGGTVNDVQVNRGETILVPCDYGDVVLSKGLDLCVISFKE